MSPTKLLGNGGGDVRPRNLKSKSGNKASSKNKGHRLGAGEIPVPSTQNWSKSEVGGFITCDRRVNDLNREQFLSVVPSSILVPNSLPPLLYEKPVLKPEDRHKVRTLKYLSGEVEEDQSIVMRYHKSKLNPGSTLS